MKFDNRNQTFNKNNKGVIQVSLHWIFVMVVGATILIFFISIVMQQRRISNENQLFELRDTMNSYIEGGKSVERGNIPISTFGASTKFECEQIGGGCSCGIIFNEKISLDTRDNVVFSTSDLGDENIFLSTSPWKFPYKVTNFVYLINPNERYILVYDESDPLIKEGTEKIFYNEIPDSVEKQLIPSSLREPITFNPLNFKKRKIIIFGDLPNNVPPTIPQFANNENTFIINIPFISPLEEASYGHPIKFYIYDPLTDRFELESNSFYLGTPSLLGSFYVDNSLNYDCAMQKAFINLHTVNKVMLERVNLLEDSSYCSAFYGESSRKPFNEIQILTQDQSKWDEVDFPQLKKNLDDLNTINDVIEGQGCPLLY